MNPARGRPGADAGGPNDNAGTEPALSREAKESDAFFREGATPQDRSVSFCCRPFLLTINRVVRLCGFNSVIERRLLDQRIEQPRTSSLFTLNRNGSQEFSASPIARCSIFLTAIRCDLAARARASLPAERSARLVLDDARLEEVAFLFQVDHLAHPRERVVFGAKQRLDADLLAAAVGDEA